MEYTHIESFLDRFRKILSQGQASSEVVAETITKHTGVEITTSMIKTKGSVIHIQGSPMLRNEVLMHTQAILSDLAISIPERRFTQIR
jgi:hypothetical protein